MKQSMLPKSITVNAGSFAPGWTDYTVAIRYTRPLRLRFWLALKLVRVATWLIGVGMDEQETEACD